MTTLIEPEFLRRLEALKNRLLPGIRRLELPRPNLTGFGISPEVESHRPYAPGDDTRYIDWNLYARLDRFYLKSMLREEEGALHLLIDASESMRHPSEEKLERALQVSAALAYIMIAAGGKVTHYSWADGITSYQEHQGQRGQPMVLLHALASSGTGRVTDLHRTLHAFVRMSEAKRARLFIISDFIDLTSFDVDLEYLRSSEVRTTAVQILHPQETSLRKRGYLRISDPETGDSVTQLVGYRALRRAEREARRFLNRTADRFRRLGFPFLRYDLDQSFEEIVTDCLMPDRGASRFDRL
ncbi:MAG: DUF58 domain-containing protein [bacterium]|nr:MAG: DUF58 domain-containing protein [bacterium]